MDDPNELKVELPNCLKVDGPKYGSGRRENILGSFSFWIVLMIWDVELLEHHIFIKCEDPNRNRTELGQGVCYTRNTQSEILACLNTWLTINTQYTTRWWFVPKHFFLVFRNSISHSNQNHVWTFESCWRSNRGQTEICWSASPPLLILLRYNRLYCNTSNSSFGDAV